MSFKPKADTSVKGNFMGRVNADIFRILSVAALQRVDDGSILRVETAADLSSAKVFVSGNVEGFERSVGSFKTAIANGMRIKRVPNLRFVLDEGDKNTARVEELLKQIRGESPKGE